MIPCPVGNRYIRTFASRRSRALRLLNTYLDFKFIFFISHPIWIFDIDPVQNTTDQNNLYNVPQSTRHYLNFQHTLQHKHTMQHCAVLCNTAQRNTARPRNTAHTIPHHTATPHPPQPRFSNSILRVTPMPHDPHHTIHFLSLWVCANFMPMYSAILFTYIFYFL